MMRHWTAALVMVIGCAAGGSGPTGAPLPVGGLRPEDRVVLGDFSRVQAIAAGPDRVFVVYRAAVGIWDPLREQWEVPRSAPTRDALVNVFSAIIDPLDRSLWMAARDGVIHFDPLLELWEQRPLPGSVTGLGIDRADPAGGLWLRTTAGWFRVPRIGPVTPGRPPQSFQPAATLEDAYRDVPGLRTLGMSLSLGPGLDPGRLTAAAPASSGTGWFVGTSTRGAFFVDRIGTRATPLTLGLPGDAVGALAAVPGGTWVATDDEPGRRPASLAFLPADLSRTLVIEGDPAFGLGIDAARRILPGDRRLWLATNVGVVTVGIDDHVVRRWGEGDGLPDQRVLTLIAWRDGVMAGTMRGVAWIRDDGTVVRPIPGLVRPIYALFARGDTLWIGTDRGLVAHVTGSPEPIGLPSWDRELGGSAPVLGIGSVGDTLIAMTTGSLLWRDPATAAWNNGPLVTATTGVLRAFHATANGAWIAGDRAAVFVRPGGGVLRALRVGPDLPGGVTAITSDEDWLWVGTLSGLVRFALSGG